jgi:hypothetical protein
VTAWPLVALVACACSVPFEVRGDRTANGRAGALSHAAAGDGSSSPATGGAVGFLGSGGSPAVSPAGAPAALPGLDASSRGGTAGTDAGAHEAGPGAAGAPSGGAPPSGLVGEPCRDDRDCLFPVWCLGGTCVALPR